MRYMELTWEQIESLDKRDKRVVLPLGAVEQHGLHLPLGVDYFLIHALAAEVERRLPDRLLLLPPVWLGHSPHHLSFAGSLSVDHAAYAEMLVGIVRSAIGAGFVNFVLLNGHGGNQLPMQMALQELKNLYPSRDDLSICGFSYWNVAREEIGAIRESSFGGMGHACELETSLMLYLHAALVQSDRIRRDGLQPAMPSLRLDMFGGSPVSTVHNFREISETGTFGDPTTASAAKGEQFFEAIVAAVTSFLEEWPVRNIRQRILQD
ncbi:creatininase family protein [Paenibacillus eucommiae]|uniref:Creatinine amidohydrolase n=1 Tax=Paenibacillus eucommiae TaxID=1355755 RepID=A0ABS4J316_9BACL|nr:creatininase family protein [Paenibacillus eucommiae]MBP1993209.1 creatinine amidohydrolase [Paenibacillus eucommiae]